MSIVFPLKGTSEKLAVMINSHCATCACPQASVPVLFVSLLESSLLQISSCRNTAHVSATHITMFFPAVFHFVLLGLKKASSHLHF